MSVKIVQGEDRDISIRLQLSPNNEPFDLQGTTDARVRFQKVDFSILEKSLTTGVQLLDPLVLGKIRVHLTDADTLLLRPGEFQDIEVEITKGTETTICQLREVLTVQARLFRGEDDC